MEYKFEYLHKLENFIEYQKISIKKNNKIKSASWSNFIIPLIPIVFIIYSLFYYNNPKDYIIISILIIIIYGLWYLLNIINNKKIHKNFYKKVFNDINGYKNKIVINNNGIEIEDDYSIEKVKWNGITELHNSKNYIILFFKHGRGLSIPKKELNYDNKKMEELIKIIKSKLNAN